ncbi:MAG: OPT/YSL family transporter, partial [Thermoanaerobaculia bacterium]
IPSLAFAVGVYLPLSSSSPILVGGMVRWAVDKWIAKKHAGKQLSEEQLVAEGDKSPGVLMASGYIAGGAIAGIIIAFLAGVTSAFDARIAKWAEANNPAFAGASADILALIPFALLIILLYLTGREKILAHRESV